MVAPPYVVVNEEGDIVHFSSRAGECLEASPGAPTRQLLAMARKDLRLDLRGALREAIETRQTVRRQNLKVGTADGGVDLVSLIVEPLPDSISGRRLFLAFFDERGRATSGQAVAAEADELQGGAARLEGELRDARERRQRSIEEHETTHEELKSTNEELESSREELRSLNVELQTVNRELYSKVEELNHANGDLRNVFADARIATVFLDRNLVIRSSTPSACELFNIIPTDTGRPLTDLATKLDYSNLQADVRWVLDSGTQMERRLRDKEVEPSHYIARLTPYRDPCQNIDGVVATFIDVTSLARSEYLRKLHADRLSSMAEMATELAHELNQPLSATATYLKAVRRLLKLSPELRPASIDEALDRATAQIMRAGKIISRLREFFASGEPNKRGESLHSLIAEACELTAGAAKEANIRMILALNAEKNSVFVDTAQIRQVLVNLILSASEAVASSRNRQITISTSLIENETIQIEVADTGRVLSESNEKDPFEPFFVTKESDLGIGLSISRLIVEAHNGKIWTQSNANGGAIFSFTLPQANAQAEV